MIEKWRRQEIMTIDKKQMVCTVAISPFVIGRSGVRCSYPAPVSSYRYNHLESRHKTRKTALAIFQLFSSLQTFIGMVQEVFHGEPGQPIYKLSTERLRVVFDRERDG